MPRTRKDLPMGSQQWADEVDKGLAKIAELEAVIRRLAENAGLDMSNPSRGVNTGATPSIQNPVGQKLSSLADVQTYNVADKQYLGWDQKGQKWLPATLPNAGGTVDISAVSYSGLTEGYGTVTDASNYAYTAAGVIDNPYGPDFPTIENWSTKTQYIGAGDYNTGPVALIQMGYDGFRRPFVEISAEDYADGTSAWVYVGSYLVTINGAYLVIHRCNTSNRPTGLGISNDDRGAMVFDVDLNIPIWWNGTTWINALGTAV